MREFGTKWLKVLENYNRTSATGWKRLSSLRRQVEVSGDLSCSRRRRRRHHCRETIGRRLRNNAGEILRCSLSLLRIKSRLVPVAGLAAMTAMQIQKAATR